MSEEIKTFADFKSGLSVRWCPGCGDHAILNSLQKAMFELGYKREEVAVISGIGCSSRLTYYMNTYGFHTIHGRASAIASGVKVANPELNVWQITGDGDALAIGGNHFIHTIRRNIDINMILFNNQIYGLTKGQYSPTSEKGFVSKTSPFGTIENPFRPGEMALGARGLFFARTVDKELKHTVEIFKEAAEHKGTSVIEVLQNCVIFNDRTHEAITDKAFRNERTIQLRHGEPMIFGENNDKGLVLQGTELKVVKLGEDNWTEKDLLVHDAHCLDTMMHLKLVNMEYPDFPVALGVIRAVKSSSYEMDLINQLDEVRSRSKVKSFKDLVFSGDVWKVE